MFDLPIQSSGARIRQVLRARWSVWLALEALLREGGWGAFPVLPDRRLPCIHYPCMLGVDQQMRLNDIAYRYELDVVLLLGARARGVVHAASDSDFAVRRGDRELSFDERLALARDLDRVMPEAEVVDLRTAPPLLCGAIGWDGRVLFEREGGLGMQVRIWAMNQYLDYQPYLRRMGSVGR